MITCLLQESPNIDRDENQALNENFLTVAYRGREPGTKIVAPQKSEDLKTVALRFCDTMTPICEILDSQSDKKAYTTSLAAQIEAIQHPEVTPSAKILSEMRLAGEPFARYAQRISEKYKRKFKAQRLNETRTLEFEKIAIESIRDQIRIEEQDSVPFDVFFKRYSSVCV